MSATNASAARARLESWKEIAAFFDRDERTVNRWEKELALPIHRYPGAKGRVYAYTAELTAWLAASRHAGLVVARGDVVSQATPASHGLTVIKRESVPAGSSPEARISSAGGSHRASRLIVASILGISTVALALLFRAGASPDSQTASHALAPSRKASPGTIVLASTPYHDPQAEQFYLEGRYYWSKRTPDDLNRALDYFTQAVVHDSNYAEAYVGLADCYNLLREYSLMPAAEAYSRALAAARKAVQLDDRSSDAHASLAFASFFGVWDLAAGEEEFRRAIDLNSNNADAHHWYANALLALRRLPEALAEIDRAQTLDPASSAILADKGNILMVAGRTDEARRLLVQMEKRDPVFRSPHLYLKNIYLRTGNYPDFISELRQDAMLLHDASALGIANAAEKGFAAGGARGMFEAMLQVQKKLYAQHSIPPTSLAETFALLGNNEQALRYLSAAYEQRDGVLLFVEIYPEFNRLQDDATYRELLAKMNLPSS